MSSPGDPYAVLGLAPDATDKQIKTAFRALAKECHPDVAGDDPAKIQRFKDLRAAYELLVDPARRAAWDRRAQRREGNPFVGSHWRNAGKPAPGSKGATAGKQDLDLEDIFNDFGGIDFGFGKKAPTPAHSSGPAPRAAGGGSAPGGPAPRSPSNAQSGRTNSGPTGRPRPTVNQWNPVDDFRKAAEEGSWPGADGEGGASQGFNGNGSGSRPTSRPIPSTGWHHQGRSRPEANVKPTVGRRDAGRVEPEAGDDIEIRVDVPADVAHRGGLVELNYPRFVRGDDQELHEIPELHELRVPPGVHEGERLRVNKQGHAGVGGGPYGDLIATVHLISARSPVEAPPGATDGPRMRMPKAEAASVAVGDAILVDIRVSEAILGGRVELDTPQGRVRISVPPGTSSGTRLRLRGRGAAGADGQPTDVFAEIRIVVPKDLDDESRALIERFSELNPGE